MDRLDGQFRPAFPLSSYSGCGIVGVSIMIRTFSIEFGGTESISPKVQTLKCPHPSEPARGERSKLSIE